MCVDNYRMIFEHIDREWRNYTWDHELHESAIALFYVDDNHFAVLTKRNEFDEDTGATGEYRNYFYCVWHMYSKNELIEISLVDIFPVMIMNGKDQEAKDKLVNNVRNQPWGKNICEVDDVVLDEGKIQINNRDVIIIRS